MYFAGIDVGALTTKAVTLKDEEVLSYVIVPTGADNKRAADKAMRNALSKAKLNSEDVKHIVATGYGRMLVPFAQKVVTEISCHAKGAYQLFSSARTVIDIGGQDSKVIRINSEGRLMDFVMNEKCAAGTGRFLEVMAHAMDVKLEELGELSLRTKNKTKINSTCTVFAESEVISNLARGASKIDVIAGIHDAIATRIQGMISRVGLERDCLLYTSDAADE